MKNYFLPFVSILFLALSLNSCKDDKDACEGVTCNAGQTCVDGNCVDNTTSIVVEGFITADAEWTSDNVYELKGRVVVKSGATLTINAGTVIKGQEGTGTNASVLIIERGAMIDAQGTAASPIIFTSVLDNIVPGQLVGTNLSETDNELWGGVIVLGSAPVSTENGDVEGQIEGIPANETYGVYGGSNANDNSGFLTYISIRHGGITIGDGNEINGLTLGGVGAGTTINHVEIVATLDDGIELFGGTVDISNAIVVYQGDDAFDIDQNYSGTINNIVGITGDGIGTDEALEIDGPEGTTNFNGLFTISNGSFWTEGTEGSAADLKSKAQGTIDACTFEGFSRGILVRASYSDTSSCVAKSDAFLYLTNASPKLVVSNNKFGTTGSLADYVTVYTASCTSCGCVDATAQTVADNEISSNGNTASSAVTGGADKTVFATWTWASQKGKI
ncbi:MAG: hypothetical protein H6579_01190 [Chitinophagales bacterium]|nr:hypothetical protein [Bacteroidota bacterium]MCB9255724.1 hypothetical protein [Chitinophagales bacterium]